MSNLTSNNLIKAMTAEYNVRELSKTVEAVEAMIDNNYFNGNAEAIEAVYTLLEALTADIIEQESFLNSLQPTF